MEIISPAEFKSLMDALTTRIKGGDYHECDEMTVNMYYQSVAVRVESTELIERFNALYRDWTHYRLPSPKEWLEAGDVQHQVNSQAYQLVQSNESAPLLPSASLTDIEKVEQQKRNRIMLLAGIYEVQGDTHFYQEMLKGRSNSYGGMILKLTGHKGVISHEEVMEQVAQNAQEKRTRKLVTS